MSTRLADRLSAARQRRFAGRSAELDLFRSAIGAPELPFVVLYLYGPGGIGKTTLLAEYSSVAAQAGARVVALDARLMDTTPNGLIAALQRGLGLRPEQEPVAFLAEQRARTVLTIDTYELLAPLDSWLRDELLPELPDDTLVVLAGREPPPLVWRTDAGWQQFFQALPLRNLSPSDSDDYLTRRAVPPEERRRVLDFTHGHPLALSLVADLFAQRSRMTFQPEEAPNIIRTLLELFVQKVPGPAHRAVLEIAALVHLTTEPLLSAMLDLPEAHELFDWLRSLSFIEATRQGLFPHDLAREALAADVRWRNPQWYAELHRRARDYYSARLQASSGAEQQHVLLDYIYLHRTNPIVRPFYEWQQGNTIAAEPATAADIPGMLALVERLEGPESARYAARWFATQLDNVLVLREVGAPASAEIAGLLTLLALDRAAPAEREADPATAAAWRFLTQHAPIRPGERATMFRFWMAHDTYQSISPAQTVLIVQVVRHYLITPQLAYTLFPVADPEFWAPLAAYADLARHPEADFTIDGRTYGVFGHDWRRVPPTAWLALLAEREVAEDAMSVRPTPAAAPQLMVLSEEAFMDAVQEAIQSYARADRLYASPLLNARVVSDRSRPDASVGERAALLQRLIREAYDALQAAPRDARLLRAVHHTYIQPAETQERAAELLDLPFSTYRRHLKQGLVRMAELIWQWELHGAG
jgi:hypothetical protein